MGNVVRVRRELRGGRKGPHVGIREMRRMIPLTLARFAKDTKLTSSYLSRVERGLVMASPYAVKRIAVALGVDFKELYTSLEREFNARKKVEGKSGRRVS